MLLSTGKVIKYVLITFSILLLLPILAVIVLRHTGISAVSDTLVKVNATGQTIQLYYPNGSLYKSIQATTTWPVQGVITLEFGESHLPFQPLHAGIDIANPEGKIGDVVTAFMPGKVVYAGEISWGFGRHVIIDHGDNITSIYAHLDKIYVKKDQEVTSGQTIGTEGETGWATGPHLHFQINVFGIPINPRLFI